MRERKTVSIYSKIVYNLKEFSKNKKKEKFKEYLKSFGVLLETCRMVCPRSAGTPPCSRTPQRGTHLDSFFPLCPLCSRVSEASGWLNHFFHSYLVKSEM